MRRYDLSADARLDLLKIWNYLAEQAGLDVADKIADELRAAMRQLARMPGMGHVRTDLASESLRFWAVRSYLIIYRRDRRPLQIVRVLHSARDVRTILRGVK